MTRRPTNVYAYARFDDGGGYFIDGGCFIIFEGFPGEFYVQRALDRASTDPSCQTISGCTCPSLNGWPSYDRRLYAFTLAGSEDACPDIQLVDHAGEMQVVSNHCRKYLTQLHYYNIDVSYFAAGLDATAERLALFDTVEVACAQDYPHANLPYQTLLTAAVQLNAGFVALEP